MKTAIIIIGVVIVLLLVAYAWFGGFAKVRFAEQQAGGEVLVYESLTGEYRHSAAAMDRIYYALLEEDKTETYKGCGIYYDNPQKVEKSKLRCDAGCLLESPSQELLQKLEGRYQIKTLPEQSYLVTEFPYKGSLSVMMGIMKVYPAMNRYLAEKGLDSEGAVTEIYDIPAKKIIYRKALN